MASIVSRICVMLVFLASPAFVGAQALQQDPGGGSRPVPDPTVLTIQNQERAIASLRELIDARFKAFDEELRQGKSSLEFQDARNVKRLDDIPGLIDDKIRHQTELMLEKFRGVDQQFAGRDVALAAALLAQKTSVDEQNKANAASSAKAEGATTKQIDGIQSIIAANSRATDDRIDGVKAVVAGQAKALDDKIADIRNTVSDIHTAIAAVQARGAGQNDIWVYLVMGGSLLIAFAGVILPRITAAAHPAPQWQPPPYYPPQQPYYQQQWQPQPQPQPQVSVVPVVPVAVPGGK